jgi:hypothetical protein
MTPSAKEFNLKDYLAFVKGSMATVEYKHEGTPENLVRVVCDFLDRMKAKGIKTL